MVGRLKSDTMIYFFHTLQVLYFYHKSCAILARLCSVCADASSRRTKGRDTKKTGPFQEVLDLVCTILKSYLCRVKGALRHSCPWGLLLIYPDTTSCGHINHEMPSLFGGGTLEIPKLYNATQCKSIQYSETQYYTLEDICFLLTK